MDEFKFIKAESGQNRTHCVCPEVPVNRNRRFPDGIRRKCHSGCYIYVKNLGTFFDTTLSMEKQCNSISRSCYMHIRKIGCIRPFILEDACKILINSLVTSRLDYGNAFLYGINKTFIQKLQRVQNTAARIITNEWIIADLSWRTYQTILSI